jgi:hypothetical protein
MKTLLYIFFLFVLIPCDGQSKIQNENAELDITITYPKMNLSQIPKTWESLNSIQKTWIKVEKDKNGYLIYKPCDGETETVKLEGANLIINWRIDNSQKFELEKFTRLTNNDAFRGDAYDVQNKIGFEIKAKIVDYQNGIVLWEFNGNKWLMTPKEKSDSFRIIKNNCKTEKKKELDFLPIEY